MKQKLTIMLALVAFMTLPGFSSQNEEWVLLKEDGGVKVFYQEGSCSDENVIFVRIVNANERNAVITWSLWGGDPVNEYAVTGNQDATGSCPDQESESSVSDLVDYIPSGKTIADLQAVVNIL